MEESMSSMLIVCDEDGGIEGASVQDDGTAEVESDPESKLVLYLDGLAEPDRTLTLVATDVAGTPVCGAPVKISLARRAGVTDGDGQLEIDVEDYMRQARIEVSHGDDRQELKVDLIGLPRSPK